MSNEKYLQDLYRKAEEDYKELAEYDSCIQCPFHEHWKLLDDDGVLITRGFKL